MAGPRKPKPLRAVIDDAAEVAPASEPAVDATPRPGGGDRSLAADPPFTLLGVLGDKCVLLDNLNQLQEKGPRELSRNGIVQLSGRNPQWLFDNYGERNKEGSVVRYKSERVADGIMVGCARLGIFAASEVLRGTGAWIGNDGRLVLHCGDAVREGDQWRSPGRIEPFIYPAGPAILRPWPTPVPGGSDGPGAAALQLFGSWNWRHPKRDPRLMVGAIGAAMTGGAIDWRPVTWITGDPGTGKSTLLKTLKGMLGRALLSSGDATQAGIRQKVGFSSLPVALDEIEAGEDDRKVQEILRLIRNSASGSTALRGGADHIGAEFTLRSCFFVNSVLPPAMTKADRSRIALLELQELAPDSVPPDLSPERQRDIGGKLLRRMADGWWRWNDTLALYRAACARKGYGARASDVYATLLAAADLLIEDAEINADHADELVSAVMIEGLDGDEASSDQDRCLQHLMTSLLPPDGPNRRSVGHWVAQAIDGIPLDDRQHSFEGVPNDGRKAANDTLATFGMRIVADDRQKWFAVANSHQALAKLFAGTHWAGRSGTTSVWKQTLQRLPGARRSETAVRFDGAATGRATLIPLPVVYTADPPATARQGSYRHD
jgi:hypothetical protein